MRELFSDMLASGGHRNSLGRVPEVIAQVLVDKSRLDELYAAIRDSDDAWVRMRAMDAFEKICREYPEWIQPYIDAIQTELAASTQASIQWHIAQLYEQLTLSAPQQRTAIAWLKGLLATTDTDWIVAANALQALAHFVRSGDADVADLLAAIHTQQAHRSPAVVRRANKILATLTEK